MEKKCCKGEVCPSCSCCICVCLKDLKEKLSPEAKNRIIEELRN